MEEIAPSCRMVPVRMTFSDL